MVKRIGRIGAAGACASALVAAGMFGAVTANAQSTDSLGLSGSINMDVVDSSNPMSFIGTFDRPEGLDQDEPGPDYGDGFVDRVGSLMMPFPIIPAVGSVQIG